MKEPDAQFRDTIFVDRQSLTKHPSESNPSYMPQLKASRSTWTKKVMKQKQNDSKYERSFEDYFQRTSTNTYKDSQLSKERRYANPSEIHRERRLVPAHQNQVFRQRIQKMSMPLHFAPNRNVYNKNVHDDLSKSGILIEKIENQRLIPLNSNKKLSDSRQFLKSLKLKNSFNLFKGNFSRFTRKDIIHCIKSKRFNLTSDLEVRGQYHQGTPFCI